MQPRQICRPFPFPPGGGAAVEGKPRQEEAGSVVALVVARRRRARRRRDHGEGRRRGLLRETTAARRNEWRTSSSGRRSGEQSYGARGALWALPWRYDRPMGWRRASPSVRVCPCASLLDGQVASRRGSSRASRWVSQRHAAPDGHSMSAVHRFCFLSSGRWSSVLYRGENIHDGALLACIHRRHCNTCREV